MSDAQGQPKPAPAAAPTPAAPAPAAPTAPAAPPKPVDPRAAARERRLAREKDLATRLADALGPSLKARVSFRDQESLTVERAKVLDCLRTAKDLGYAVLMDVTAVDYLRLEGPNPERFAVVYCLQSLTHEARVRLKAYVPEDDPKIASATALWPAADWGEREAFDMFGIEFTGHPNLKRILMPDDFGSFPLRKEYPLRGRGERDNFAVLKRGQNEVDA